MCVLWVHASLCVLWGSCQSVCLMGFMPVCVSYGVRASLCLMGFMPVCVSYRFMPVCVSYGVRASMCVLWGSCQFVCLTGFVPVCVSYGVHASLCVLWGSCQSNYTRFHTSLNHMAMYLTVNNWILGLMTITKNCIRDEALCAWWACTLFRQFLFILSHKICPYLYSDWICVFI